MLALPSRSQHTAKLKATKWFATQVPEPSDICYSAASDTYFVVSDDGILFETNPAGEILRKIAEANCDYEAVYADDNFVYAVDETHRAIHCYERTTLKCNRIVNVPYQGGRNAGYEAFTFNKANGTFILLTEKNPITLIELDLNFNIKNQMDLSGIARDISAASFYDGFLWLLSDEDRTVFKLNPLSYEVIGKWQLPVINPEGFAFDKIGNLVVTCDDMQRIYFFNNPEKN